MAAIIKKPVVIAAGVLLGFLLISASGNALETRRKIRVAYTEWGVSSAVVRVGIDGGIFKKFSIDVDEAFIKDRLSGGIQSLIGTDIFLGFGNPLTVVNPILGGVEIVLLGSHVSVEQYAMAVSEGISKVGDLKGKKVGVSRLGGKSDLVARVMLRRAGLDPIKDVEIVAAGYSPNRAAALLENLIQATPLNRGRSAQAKDVGLKVLEPQEVPLVTSALLTTRSFVKNDEKLVRRFVKAYATAIHFYLTRRHESIEIIKKYFDDTEPESLEAMYETFASQLKPLPVFNTETLQAIIDVASVADKRAADIKPETIIDDRFLKEINASGYIDKLYFKKDVL